MQKVSISKMECIFLLVDSSKFGGITLAYSIR